MVSLPNQSQAKDLHYKKITLVLFGFVIISYFTVYGFIGSFNAGSSQRFRVNYIPIGIFFPLILEKNIRDKFELKSRSLKKWIKILFLCKFNRSNH